MPLQGLSRATAAWGDLFTPANRSYTGVVSDQTAQNYDTLVFGDVDSGFVERVDGPSPTTPDDGMSAGEVPVPAAEVALPDVAIDASVTNFIAQVTTTTINAGDKLVGAPSGKRR